MRDAKTKDTLRTITVFIFFTAFAFSLLHPIKEPDLFWHLKTGEWIWQNRALPDQDPFAPAAAPIQGESSIRTSFILKQYWLAQLIMYGLYQLAGFYGIIALRCLLYLGIALMLYFRMGKFGTERITRLLFLIPACYFSVGWLGERPNNFSIFFAVLTVSLLEDLRNPLNSSNGSNSSTRLKLAGLPLTMLLWANTHAGFLIGVSIIVLYMIAGSFKRLFAKNGQGAGENSFTFFLVCALSIALSLINPNTYKGIYITFQVFGPENIIIPIAENFGPLYYAKIRDYFYLIVISSAILPFLPKIRDLRLSSMLLIFFLTVLSFQGVRFIPFLVFISTPFIAGLWGNSLENLFSKAGVKIRAANLAGTLLAPVAIAIIFAIFIFASNMNRTIFRNNPVYSLFPEEAARFIKTEKPDGEIFNEYILGGYLIWSLYPDYKPVIDGRGLHPSMFRDYLAAYSGTMRKDNGLPLWKSVLERYGVRTVIAMGTNYIGGGFTGLVHRLADDKDWHLVFADKEALLFIKDTEKNRKIIDRFPLPKTLAYGMALRQAEMFRLQFPDDWRAYATLTEINLYMGRPKNALLHFESAARLNASLRKSVMGKIIDDIRNGRDYNKLLEEASR